MKQRKANGKSIGRHLFLRKIIYAFVVINNKKKEKVSYAEDIFVDSLSSPFLYHM